MSHDFGVRVGQLRRRTLRGSGNGYLYLITRIGPVAVDCVSIHGDAGEMLTQVWFKSYVAEDEIVAEGRDGGIV